MKLAEQWIRNIRASIELVERNQGPDFVTVVAGSEFDTTYWTRRFERTCPDVVRRDGHVLWISSPEEERKGNFLGTLKAWARTKQAFAEWGRTVPTIGLMSMVFGKGTRLSPFTQSLGNRKPAFPVPLQGKSVGQYLCTAELCNLQSNLLIHHLKQCGFRGLLVKWGDEAIIPATAWATEGHDFSKSDAVRFVGQVRLNERLASQKEWIASDAGTGLMIAEYSRQDVSSLERRLSAIGGSVSVGVNLGSFAVSYDFLDAAFECFRDDIDEAGKWADWDPYLWIALFCPDEAQWRQERELERQTGRTGIRELEARYPDFFQKAWKLRQVMQRGRGRPMCIHALDFGEPFWFDMGSHVTLRQCLQLLAADSPAGRVTRELFQIPDTRDKHGNILVRSTVPEQADVRQSVIVDSVILDNASCIHGGVVLRGRHRRVDMPYGGIALDCAADHLVLPGPNAVAYRAVGAEIAVPAGGRRTTLFAPEGHVDMISSESIIDYSGDNYSQVILDNPLSFEEAGRMMASCDPVAIENRWLAAWNGWLK